VPFDAPLKYFFLATADGSRRDCRIVSVMLPTLTVTFVLPWRLGDPAANTEMVALPMPFRSGDPMSYLTSTSISR
jgi:hypothetical protein